jgi:hypothetical protein
MVLLPMIQRATPSWLVEGLLDRELASALARSASVMLTVVLNAYPVLPV